MLDGFIARISKSESELGDRLDSVADIIFVIMAMIKILQMLNLTNVIIYINSIILEIIICSVVTFAAVQEGYYIRTRK